MALASCLHLWAFQIRHVKVEQINNSRRALVNVLKNVHRETSYKIRHSCLLARPCRSIGTGRSIHVFPDPTEQKWSPETRSGQLKAPKVYNSCRSRRCRRQVRGQRCSARVTNQARRGFHVYGPKGGQAGTDGNHSCKCTRCDSDAVQNRGMTVA